MLLFYDANVDVMFYHLDYWDSHISLECSECVKEKIWAHSRTHVLCSFTGELWYHHGIIRSSESGLCGEHENDYAVMKEEVVALVLTVDVSIRCRLHRSNDETVRGCLACHKFLWDSFHETTERVFRERWEINSNTKSNYFLKGNIFRCQLSAVNSRSLAATTTFHEGNRKQAFELLFNVVVLV